MTEMGLHRIPVMRAALVAIQELHKAFEAEEYYNGMEGESLSRIVYECAGCADAGGIVRFPCETRKLADEGLAGGGERG